MPLPGILFFLLLPILLWLFSTWDGLVRFEHDYFHQQWLDDGEPAGMFWRPPNWPKPYTTSMATTKLMLVWLFKNPEWVEDSDEGMTLIKRYRVLFIAWNGSIILFLFTGLILAKYFAG